MELQCKEGSMMAAFFDSVQLALFGGRAKTTRQTYHIDKLQTLSFYPKEEYVLETLRQSGIRNYLQKHFFKKSLYMIVGIRIAEGARVFQGDRQGRVIGAGARLSGVGSLVGGGLQGSTAKGSGTSAEFSISDKFVFAYRLRKCRYYHADRLALKNFKFVTTHANLHSLDDPESDRDDLDEPRPTAIALTTNMELRGNISGVDVDDKALGLGDEVFVEQVNADESNEGETESSQFIMVASVTMN